MYSSKKKAHVAAFQKYQNGGALAYGAALDVVEHDVAVHSAVLVHGARHVGPGRRALAGLLDPEELAAALDGMVAALRVVL